MTLRQRLLRHLTLLIGHPISLRLALWDGDCFDFSTNPNVILTLTTPRAGRLMLRGDLERLCDAYISGEVLVDGSVRDILSCGIALANALGRVPLFSKLAKVRGLLPRSHSRPADRANIRFHYDISNDFYRLWLDRGMVYSCAYFKSGREDLDKAQEQKLDLICRKLDLRRGERFLDIGCGWGGLVCWAARNYAVAGFGATISSAQYEYASALSVADSGGQIEFQLQDYRDLASEQSFDKIASVGMYEHAGLRNLSSYFRKISGLLKPSGALLNQGIYLPNAGGIARGPRVDFVGRHVFPGGELPTLAAVVHGVTQAGLEVADFEDLRPHYVRTLSLWLARLEANKARAIEIAGPERYRVWRMFLGGMAFAFDEGWLSVGQLLAYKPGGESGTWRPWTRQHQYPDQRPVMSERLNWREAEGCEAAHV